VEGVPAFWPFIQVLRAALDDCGPAEMRRFLGREGFDLAEAMPELRELVQAAPQPKAHSTHAARFRSYDGMACFFRRAARAQPIVVGIDDLQHADAATLQLLSFLARELRDARVLWVGTFRREAHAAAAVPPLLEALLRHDAARGIELDGFTTQELARYLELTASIAPPAEVVSALHEQTAGNPLFVRHLVESWRALGEHSELEPFRGLVSLRSGHGLQGAILRHLEVVSPSGRSLLRMAAVLGREFGAAPLARLSEQPVSEVYQALASAETTGLIQQQPAQLDRYRFTHALIRDALYLQLQAAERAKLHGRAGLALEALAGGSESYVHLAEITRHFVLAAPACDHGRAFDYCLRAANSALARLAHEEAAEHFEHALQLSAYLPPDPARQLSLVLRKGDALARTSDPDAGRAALFEAAELAQHLHDDETLFTAATLLAGRPEPGTVDERQLEVLERAHAALREDDGRRVLLLAMQAKSLAYASTPHERVRRGRLALAQARALTDPLQRSDALVRCLDALVGPDQLEERSEIAHELLQAARTENYAPALMGAWAAQIEICVERGDMLAVDTALQSMEELALRVRDPLYRWLAKAARSMQAFVQGKLDQSELHAREALQLGAAVGEELARHIYCAQSFSRFLVAGMPLEADKLGREMAARYPGIAGWVAAVGVGDAVLGRREQARTCLDRILERGVSWVRSEPYMLSGLCAVAELCQVVGDAKAAQALYSATLPYASRHGLTHIGACHYGPMTRILGGLAACAGDVATADKHYDEAMRASLAIASPTFECMTALSHAFLLLKSGKSEQRPKAQQLIERARQLAERHTLAGLLDQCVYLTQRHGLADQKPNIFPIQGTRGRSRG
jgi:hypothetical protein